MTPNAELVDDLFVEKVRSARALPFDRRLLLPAELFDAACDVTRVGIRHQHPDADPAEVERILLGRLALQRRLES